MRGASERLSPILMTALATALALAPLVIFGGRPGQEIENPMAIVILGGLATSTLMNLFVLPALYLWVAGFSQRRPSTTVSVQSSNRSRSGSAAKRSASPRSSGPEEHRRPLVEVTCGKRCSRRLDSVKARTKAL